MIVQISSGQGPVECELAVRLFFEALKKEFTSENDLICTADSSATSFKIIQLNESRFCNGFSSIIFETECDLSFLQGSIEWRCKSFLRPGHKRKNWFIDVAILPDTEEECEDGRIQCQFFRCGGKGGQNVNKVESGVRIIHVQSGISVTCTEERSQFMNRRRALEKLHAILLGKKDKAQEKSKEFLWQHQKKLVRGQAVRIYEGEKFILKT